MNTAKWIWIDKNGPRKNCYARFFREFFIKPDEQNPTGEIRISVSDNYTLYLNGNFISCGQYKDYPDLKHYDCLKLDPFLQIGKKRSGHRRILSGRTELSMRSVHPQALVRAKGRR